MMEYGEANVQAHIRALSLSALDDGEWPIAQLVNFTPGGKTTDFFSLRNEFVNFNYCTLAIITTTNIIKIFMDWLLFSSDCCRLIVASIFHTDVLIISLLFL
jgi:hypothetical protein